MRATVCTPLPACVLGQPHATPRRSPSALAGLSGPVYSRTLAAHTQPAVPIGNAAAAAVPPMRRAVTGRAGAGAAIVPALTGARE